MDVGDGGAIKSRHGGRRRLGEEAASKLRREGHEGRGRAAGLLGGERHGGRGGRQ